MQNNEKGLNYTIWSVINDDKLLAEILQKCDAEFILELHREFNITVLQWLLWYVGSGIKAYTHVKYGLYNRKDWAFHKINIIHTNLPKELWSKLVHAPTGFSKKCTTIHFFTRNGYSVEPHHLDSINAWFDEVNGRFLYKQITDEYGITPGLYVDMHRKRNEIFRKKAKSKVDVIVKKYHAIEEDIILIWKNDINCPQDDYYEWLKYVASNDTIWDIPIVMRKKILESGKLRIESHLLHSKIFDDRLVEIEKAEEAAKRFFSQTTNHCLILKSYQKLLEGTFEGSTLKTFLKKI
jgi:hypothetical protein